MWGCGETNSFGSFVCDTCEFDPVSDSKHVKEAGGTGCSTDSDTNTNAALILTLMQ